MKSHYLIACGAVLLAALSAAPTFGQTQLAQKPYSGTEVSSSDVLAAWHFDGDGNDASGNQHHLELRGKDTHFVKDGKFGGALEMKEDAAEGDTRQGAALPKGKNINPRGAFTVEMWISPSEQLADKTHAFLIDNKNFYYADKRTNANRGYLLKLLKSGSSQFVLFAGLGFGKDSSFVRSVPLTFEAGKWYHVAFTYDGKGLCTFYLNAERIVQTQLENRGAITPSSRQLTIGDRVGSLGHRFPGKIDEVRILNKAERFITGKVLLSTDKSRTTFSRMEKDAVINLEVFNDTIEPLQNAKIQVNLAESSEKSVDIPSLAAGKSTFIPLPMDTSLKPGKYEVKATLQSGANMRSEATFPFTVVPRALPHEMPIVLWATGSSHPTTTYKDITDIGYTDELTSMYNYAHIWKNRKGKSLPKDRVITTRKKIDDMMAAGLGSLATLRVGTVTSKIAKEYNRVNREGKTPENNGKPSVNTARPEVQQFAYDIGASVARTFGDMPNWHGTLLGSEARDHSYPSFTDFDKKAYRDFSGADIPKDVLRARGVSYEALDEFPANRVVPDDHPILKYYKWYWQKGDGWNDLNTRVNAGLKSTGRNDIFNWVDPAVRVPSIWGSGGNVDMLNQWTYTYPNPLVNDLATNELFAMADGHPGQKVMNMIQIIWKRWDVTNARRDGNKAKSKTKEEDQKEWEKIVPDAPYISIAPDHLSEATWLELTHPVSAIANHGWGSLGDELGFKQGSYHTTNVESRKRMAEMFQNVVKPLAPTLLQVSERPTDVAFLQSFTSQIFTTVGTYGWGHGWGADSYAIARYAGLHPKIIYEDHIKRDGLNRYKVLFMTDCPVLPQSIVEAIKKYQKNGGIIVGDETLTPAIQPDITLTKMRRIEPAKMKAQMQKQAADLVELLAPFYSPVVESDNPDVVTSLRQKGNAQYVFTINDHRTYGDYLGQYKKVMEKGLPAQTQITLNQKAEGFVYDLMKHRQVQTKRTDGKVLFPVELEAGGGNLFLVTDKPVGNLQISAPASAKRGAQVSIKVLLSGDSDAIIPAKVTVRDAAGNIAEKSGYYGIANGQLQIDLDIAPNDTLGKWQIEVTNNATGQSKTANFTVS